MSPRPSAKAADEALELFKLYYLGVAEDGGSDVFITAKRKGLLKKLPPSAPRVDLASKS
jgi:hypothetical protein